MPPVPNLETPMHPPAGFPRMAATPSRIDALSWYPPETPGLFDMSFQARDEVVPLWKGDPDGSGMFGVPRTCAPMATPEDRRSVGVNTFEAEFTSELRPHQIPFCNKTFRMLEDELGGIGEAETGFGKTVCGTNIIARVGLTTCVLIPKGDLDWKPELLKHTNIPESKISEWRGQTLPDPEAWVVVASLQSVYRDGHYPQEVYNRFGFLVADEVHRLGAPEFSAALRKFPAMFRLGLSATPDRRDGKMDLIHAHMGWTHVVGANAAEPPDYFVIRSDWVEPFGKDGKRVRYDPKRTNWAKRSLMKDFIRNGKIAAACLRAHKAGRRTIIFIEQIEHGETLEKALRAMGVPAYAIVQYNGKSSKDDAARAKAAPPGIVIIATYKFTAEGTNIPALDTAVIAHPIYDARQAVGRILRKLDDKLTPVVLDVWDVHCGSLMHIAKARWEGLRKKGAKWKGDFA